MSKIASLHRYKGLEKVRSLRHIGLIGGTFDPIHQGHLVIAEEVRATLNLCEMVFIPVGEPPHKPRRKVTAAHHRLEMLRLAIASNPHFSYSRIELDRPGPSYSVNTLQLLHQQWDTDTVQTALYFVIGWDSLEELHTWYNPLGILAQLAHLVAVSRPGYTEDVAYLKKLEQRLPGITRLLLAVQAPQLAISSTDLRLRVAQGRPIKYQTPEVVEQYIKEHALYRS